MMPWVVLINFPPVMTVCVCVCVCVCVSDSLLNRWMILLCEFIIISVSRIMLTFCFLLFLVKKKETNEAAAFCGFTCRRRDVFCSVLLSSVQFCSVLFSSEELEHITSDGNLSQTQWGTFLFFFFQEKTCFLPTSSWYSPRNKTQRLPVCVSAWMINLTKHARSVPVNKNMNNRGEARRNNTDSILIIYLWGGSWGDVIRLVQSDVNWVFFYEQMLLRIKDTRTCLTSF